MKERARKPPVRSGEVDEEDLADGDRDHGGRGEAERLRRQGDTGEEKRHAEGEPDGGIGVQLGVAHRAGASTGPRWKRVTSRLR